MCIFCKIISGEIKSEKLYEDNDCIVIKDINPIAKNHYLLIPKTHYPFLSELNGARAAELANCFLKLDKFIPLFGLENGYRLIINQGDDAGQTVPHIHIHILAGNKLNWDA